MIGHIFTQTSLKQLYRYLLIKLGCNGILNYVSLYSSFIAMTTVRWGLCSHLQHQKNWFHLEKTLVQLEKMI